MQIVQEHRPELVIFGKSMFLYPEPVREVAAAVQSMDPRPVLLFDMAHVLGLYGTFQAPLAEGADVVTGSTHKTFFGPQRGVVVSNLDKDAALRKLWLEIKSRAFPGSTSNHHLGTLLGLLVATVEMNAFKPEYQTAVVRNARAFARALAAAGIQVEGDPSDGFTQTHQVVIRVRAHGTGEDIARRLERNHIVTNYQALPDDGSFANTSGVRLGVQEMTRFGMEERDFETLAGFVADVVRHDRDVAAAVARERQRFADHALLLGGRSSPADVGGGLGGDLAGGRLCGSLRDRARGGRTRGTRLTASQRASAARTTSSIQARPLVACGQPSVVTPKSATCSNSARVKPSRSPRRACECTAPSWRAPSASASFTRRCVRASSGPACASAASNAV